MRTSTQAARKATPYAALVSQRFEPADLKDLIVATLDEAKAIDIVALDVAAKTAMADHMVIASGTSHRQVGALADRVAEALKKAKHGTVRIEGLPDCDWVLIDAGSVIVHIFRPEAREFYKLEKMWSGERAMGDDTPTLTAVAAPD